ncbi:MAG: carbonic anhydrase [Ilumatobacter sp.]|uniref:carbonic anhydrase n=1 Tax=Ilumatobacter sp. TaxID=1967498 RepID=UPI00391D6A8F
MSESSWTALAEGHQRVEATTLAAHAELPPRHAPKAAILACSDARVPPSVVFDQPAGNLFVIRIAGNTACPAALASLDYAVSELGVDLVVVLGHTSCGAVTAAASGTCGGHLAPIVAPICEIARRYPGVAVDDLAALNVLNTMDELSAHDGPVGQAITSGAVEVRGALHDLVTGRLRTVTADASTADALAADALAAGTLGVDTGLDALGSTPGA